jgi:ribosomal-protein-alanine N-acetyltransferase
LTSGSDSETWLNEVIIQPMTAADLDEVLAIECESFPSAWSRGSYERELRNDNSFYFVARHQGNLVGYAGMWIIFEEAHITTVAVHSDCRRRGLGTRLLYLFIELAREHHASRLTLEVREGNHAAIALYARFGFEQKGLLPNYYGDTGEDGIVMWKTL